MNTKARNAFLAAVSIIEILQGMFAVGIILALVAVGVGFLMLAAQYLR